MDPPIKTTMQVYTQNVEPTAQSVPFGIDLLGSSRSPDMDAPARIPMQAGKSTPNTVWKLCLAPSGPFVVVNRGHRFSCSVSHENEVYSMLRSG